MTPRSLPPAAALLAALLLAPGCTKEFSRVSLNGPGSAEVTIDLDDGADVVVSVDTEYEATGRGGGVTALEAYRLSLAAVQHRRLAASALCSPLRVTSTGWGRERRGESVRLIANRVGDCRLHLAKGGPTTFKVTLSELRKPDINLHYLDVILEK